MALTQHVVLNVRDFGAIGNSTDDTVAIQNAINYAYAHPGGTPPLVYIPCGIYHISNKLDSKGISIKGEGVGTLLVSQYNGSCLELGDITVVQKQTLEDLSITSDPLHTTVTGIEVNTDQADITIRNVQVTSPIGTPGFSFAGVSLYCDSVPPIKVCIENCNFSYNDGSGIDVSVQIFNDPVFSNIFINNCSVLENGDRGFSAFGARISNVEIKNTEFIQNTASVMIGEAKNVVIKNCRLSGGGSGTYSGALIRSYVSGPSDRKIQGLEISECYFTPTGASNSIYLVDSTADVSRGVSIKNCVFDDSSVAIIDAYHIEFDASSSFVNVEVLGNTVTTSKKLLNRYPNSSIIEEPGLENGLLISEGVYQTSYSYAVTGSASVIVCANTSPIIVDLPPPPDNVGRTITVKRIGSDTVSVQVPGGYGIDGASNYDITNAYGYLTVVSDGTKWLIVSKY